MAAPARAVNRDPSQWPAQPGLDPSLSTTAHSIRFYGADRYQTNVAINLALRGNGGFPFDTPDPTSDWWGAKTCPRSILVVAGDTFADALAAASLSDPTDQSDQPRVRRVAAADPLFDPIGGFDRVDTAAAPIVVTTSARQGARRLAPTARFTARDLNNGGCTTAREAIIVGGTGSVPAGAEAELVELGYEEVFRVSGDDRYGTAAAVAMAMGTEAVDPATPCADPDSTDGSTRMGFYGNGAIEYRGSATSCRVLPRTVVLADGGTGADALAAGWWTSRWQVPILLVAPDGSLPPATRTALQELDVDTIVVLGGAGRIPEGTVQEARDLAGAIAGRFAGEDRYETSVVMAAAFGGWHATGSGSDFDADLVCLAASSGDGATATGWPDALAAGPWCGRGGAGAAVAPARALPASGDADAPGPVVAARRPSHDAVPILLVPPAPVLPASVDAFLREAFAPSSAWCDGEGGDPCLPPGFTVTFGGSSGVTTAGMLSAARRVAGGSYVDPRDLSASSDGAFATALDLAPVFTVAGGGDAFGCFPSGAVRSTRWLVAPSAEPVARDLVSTGGFDSDATGAEVSEPLCLALAEGLDVVELVSVSGHVTDVVLPDPSTARSILPSRAVGQLSTATSDATEQRWSTSGAPSGPVDVLVEGAATRIDAASLDLSSRVGSDAMTGSFTLRTSAGEIFGAVDARSTTVDGVVEVRGRVRVTGTDIALVGGFQATIAASGDVTWTFDSYR